MPNHFLINLYQDAQTDNFLKYIEQNNKHPQETHVGLSDAELLDRGLFNHISVGTFDTVDDYKKCLLESIKLKEQEIQKFLYQAQNRDIHTCHIVLDKNYYPFKAHNRCFYLNNKTNKISEVTTNTYTLVLRKNDNADYGFNLVTFYPTANTKYIQAKNIQVENTNKDLNPILIKTRAYHRANLLEKTALKAKIDPNINSQIRYTHNDQTYSHVIAVTNVNNSFHDTVEIGFDFIQYRDKHGQLIQNEQKINILQQQNPNFQHDVETIIALKKQIQAQQLDKRLEQTKRVIRLPYSMLKSDDIEKD